MRKGCVIFFILPFILCLLTSCNSRKEAQVISDLAYSSRNQDECIVYLQEDGEYIPFIVVTDDYNGNVLLVRKEVLPEPRRINEYFSYYENSEIDQYLNEEYLNTIAESELILTSQIVITDESALGICGDSVKTIERRVFLLSLTETGFDDRYNTCAEGKPLKFFETPDNRIAFKEERTSSWWLRSPDTSTYSCTYGIGPNVKLGSGNAYNKNGIRPAFCLSASTGVCVSQGEDGEPIYTLSLEG